MGGKTNCTRAMHLKPHLPHPWCSSIHSHCADDKVCAHKMQEDGVLQNAIMQLCTPSETWMKTLQNKGWSATYMNLVIQILTIRHLSELHAKPCMNLLDRISQSFMPWVVKFVFPKLNMHIYLSTSSAYHQIEIYNETQWWVFNLQFGWESDAISWERLGAETWGWKEI